MSRKKPRKKRLRMTQERALLESLYLAGESTNPRLSQIKRDKALIESLYLESELLGRPARKRKKKDRPWTTRKYKRVVGTKEKGRSLSITEFFLPLMVEVGIDGDGEFDENGLVRLDNKVSSFLYFHQNKLKMRKRKYNLRMYVTAESDDKGVEGGGRFYRVTGELYRGNRTKKKTFPKLEKIWGDIILKFVIRDYSRTGQRKITFINLILEIET